MRAGERAVFIGMPGFGKSNQICFLLGAGVESAVVFDSKRHPEEYAAWGPKHGFLVTQDPAMISQHPKVIFQVDQRSLLDRGGWQRPGSTGWLWTDALQRTKARGNTVVVFDEVIQTLPAGASHPEAVTLYTQGRAWGLSCWAGTQVPNRMETLVVRIAEHCFCFWCGNHKDRDMIAGCRSVDSEILQELQRPPSDKHYAYHGIGAQQWIVCKSVENVISGKSRGSAKRKTLIEEDANGALAEPEMPAQDAVNA